VICANVGDCRAIVGNLNASTCTQLSVDHKPNLETESKRIYNAGHFVTSQTGIVNHKEITVHRVDGRLAMSRAFGDWESKAWTPELTTPPANFAVTPVPEIKAHPLTSGDYVLQACDGIWDVLDNTEVHERVVSALQQRVSEISGAEQQTILNELAREIVSIALARGSQDNCTVVIALIK
jgi:protein phosphatase 1B